MKPRPLFVRGTVLCDSVRKKLDSCSAIILLLDFDGTLAPIRKTPSLAKLPARTRVLLRTISGSPKVILGLVTGRSRSDIRAKIGMRDLLLITNHGFEISSRGSHWVHPAARRIRPLITEMASKLRGALRPAPNVLIENKRYTLSVHYRNVQKRLVPFVERQVRSLLRSYRDSLRMTRGKKVFEVRPGERWNKGLAVLKVLRSVRRTDSSLVVYVGDDTTDEDVFRLLRRGAVTVVVGNKPRTAASFCVRNPGEVARFLKLLQFTLFKGTKR